MKGWLTKYLGYYANELFLFKNEQFINAPIKGSKPKVIIMAKNHFTETWQSFPSVNRKELDKILALKEQAQTESISKFQVFKNDKIDGFDVRIMTLDKAMIESLGEDKLFLPETDILAMNDADTLLQVESPAGKLFCVNVNGIIKSSYAKGIMVNIDTFKLTVGLPSDVDSQEITKSNFAQFLLMAIFNSSLSNLMQASVYNVKSWCKWNQLHLLYWAPLLTALSFYSLTSAYYYAQSNLITRGLEQGGSEVSEILQKKRAVDKNRSEIKTLSDDFGKQNYVHFHWQVIDKLLENGMIITRATYDAPILTIRGTADKASDVLAMIAKNEHVKSAAFQGSVRKSRGKDSFVLTLDIKDN